MSARRILLPTLVLLALTAAPAAAEYDTVLVSRNGLAGPAGDDQSYDRPSISGDGRYIAFFTLAGNFPGGLKGSSRAYRKDTVTGDVVLVSRKDGPDGAPVGGNHPEISRDGRFACFGDGLYARDIDQNRTFELPAPPVGFPAVPPAPAGANSAAADDLTSRSCAISDDGTKVAVMTPGRFVAEDTDGGLEDIYVWDVPTGAMTLVSRANGPAGVDADGPAFGPSMTRDGRYVAFWSRAWNLSDEDPDPVADVFVRDLQTGTTTWVSRPGAGASGGVNAGGYGSYDPAISDDGTRIAFASWTRLDAAVNAAPATKWIFRRDLTTGTTHLVSRVSGPAGAPSDGISDNPSFSPDGRYVAFETFANNLDLESLDGPGNMDVFIRDGDAQRTTLVSRAGGVFGAAADGYSFGGVLAANNARVAFVSRAENLAADDVALGDVFYRDTVGSQGLLPADLPGAPKIAAVKVTSGVVGARARVSAERAARVSFTLSEFTRETVIVERRTSTRRWKRAGTLALVGTEGRNVLRIGRATLGRSLQVGTYRARIAVKDFNAQRASRTVSFRVRRAR
jgi:Tol biopolymer transport system component